MEEYCDLRSNTYGIAIDSSDTLFVANITNNSIDRVRNKLVTKGSKENVCELRGVAFDANEVLHVGDASKIYKLSNEGNLYPFVGTSPAGFQDGIGDRVKMNSVTGLCFDEQGNGIFCDFENNRIRKVTPDGTVSTLFGNGKEECVDGKGTSGSIKRPLGIAFDRERKLFYITDYFNKRIRVMTLDGTVTTFCKYPCQLHAITIDGNGNLYVSSDGSPADFKETFYNVVDGILRISPTGKIEYIQGTSKGMHWCSGLAFNSRGDLFAATSQGKIFVIKNCTPFPPKPMFHPNTYSPTLALKDSNNTPKKESPATPRTLSNSGVPEEVITWLERIELSNLEPVLLVLGVVNMKILKEITNTDLEQCGVPEPQARYLLREIEKLNIDKSDVLHHNIHL